MADQSTQAIGKAMIVYGTVKAVSPDGVERIVTPNSPIFFQDRINTGSDGAVSIVFTDPADTQLDLGRMTDMVIDQDVIGGSPIGFEEVTAEVEAIQQALEGGGEIDVAATAAGPGGAVGPHGGTDVDGKYIVRFEVDGREVNPTFGAETQGVDHGFVGTELTPAVPPVFVEESVIPEPTPEPATVFVAQPLASIIPETEPPPPEEPPYTPPNNPPNYQPSIGNDEVVLDETFFDTTGDNDLESAPPDELPTILVGSVNVDFGLDGPGSIYGNGAYDASAPGFVLGGLQSQGRDVTVTVDEDGNYIGTVPAGEGTFVVFSLEFNDAVPGQYVYTQYGQLDHPDDTDGNDTIMMNFGITVEDSNGDKESGTITINVLDDQPQAIGESQTLYVYEDSLQNDDGSNENNLIDGEGASSNDNPAVGNLEGEFQDDASINLWQFVDLGADEYPQDSGVSPFSLTGEGISLNITSKGEPIVIKEISTTHIQGVVEGDAVDRVVFEIFLDGSNLIFDLDDQIDHEGLGDNEFLSDGSTDDSFDIGRFVQVTDFDGDRIDLIGKIIVDVENDIPALTVTGDPLTGAVQEDALGNEGNDPAADDLDASTGNEDAPGVDTDTATIQLSSLVSGSTGADEPGSVTYSLASLTNQSTVYTSNGAAVTYSTSGNTLTASAGGTTVFTFTVDAITGEAVFNLNGQVDHSGAGDDGELLHINDLGQYVTVSIEDVDHDVVSTDFTGMIDISVENDIPVGGNPQNVFLANEYHPDSANIKGTGDLNFEVGADEEFQNISINWDPKNVRGGLIVDNDGVPLTSNGQPLEFATLPDGTVVGKIVGTDTIIFTVTPDQTDGHYTGTYTVELTGPLDGSETKINIPLGTKGGGLAYSRDIQAGTDIDLDGDPDTILIHATGRTGADKGVGGSPAQVNWSTSGMGIEDASKIGANESLILEFINQDNADADNDGNDDEPATPTLYQSYDDMVFRLDHLDTGETATITVYSGGTTGTIVGYAEITGTDSGSSDASDDLVTISTGVADTNPGSNPGTGPDSTTDDLATAENDWGISASGSFDTVVFEYSGTVNGDYRVVDVSLTETQAAQDLELTFTAEATDIDGDTATSEEFIVGFEGDSSTTIDGTDEADVIVGSSHDDIIDGLGGDDVIYGGDGSDIIDGGDGNDFLVGDIDDDFGDGIGDDVSNDTIVGGPGDDILIGGQGADSLDGGAGDDILVGDAVDFDGADPDLLTTPDIEDDGVADTIVGGDTGEDGIDGSTFAGDVSVDAYDPSDPVDDVPESISGVEAEVVEGEMIDPGGEDIDPLVHLVPPPEDAS